MENRDNKNLKRYLLFMHEKIPIMFVAVTVLLEMRLHTGSQATATAFWVFP